MQYRQHRLRLHLPSEMFYPAAFADNLSIFPVNWQALLSERTEDVASNILACNVRATPAPAPAPEPVLAPALVSLLINFKYEASYSPL